MILLHGQKYILNTRRNKWMVKNVIFCDFYVFFKDELDQMEMKMAKVPSIKCQVNQHSLVCFHQFLMLAV